MVTRGFRAWFPQSNRFTGEIVSAILQDSDGKDRPGFMASLQNNSAVLPCPPERGSGPDVLRDHDREDPAFPPGILLPRNLLGTNAECP